MLGEDDSEAPRWETPCHVEPGTVSWPCGAATVPSLQPEMFWQAYFFGQSCRKLRRFTRVWNGLVPWIK